MRIRKKKNAAPRMERCARVWIKEPLAYRGRWNGLFKNEGPLHLEIGCGKGGFITELAKREPGTNFVAVEKVRDCLVMAMEKAVDAGLENVYFVLGDAGNLNDMFADGECSRIYLNFSDPWVKARHYKRRLTYRDFLEKYRRVLAGGGEIRFKTDNRALFDFSLEELAFCRYELKFVTYDLHGSGFEGNIMTEYERNFSEKGFNICMLTAVPPPADGEEADGRGAR